MVTFETGGGVDWVGVGLVIAAAVAAASTAGLLVLAQRNLSGLREQLQHAQRPHLIALDEPRHGFAQGRIRYSIQNIGLGPAREIRVRVWLDERTYEAWRTDFENSLDERPESLEETRDLIVAESSRPRLEGRLPYLRGSTVGLGAGDRAFVRLGEGAAFGPTDGFDRTKRYRVGFVFLEYEDLHGNHFPEADHQATLILTISKTDAGTLAERQASS